MATEPQNSARSWGRIDGIDLLRGLAIFFVLMNHVNMRLFGAQIPYLRGIPNQLAHSLVWNGQFGVQIFFVISGFLITSITLRRWGPLQRVNVRDFYLLRFARIAPLLFLLLAVLSALHLAQLHDFVVSPKTGGLGRALFAALTFHVNVLEASRGYLPGAWDVLWSLSVEEMFYLFFPVLARLLGRGKLFITLLIGFALLGPFGRTVFAHGNPVWTGYSYLGGMDAIAIGCLTALLISRVQFSRMALKFYTAAGVSLLVLILGFSGELWMRTSLGRRGLDESILAIGTSFLIIAAVQAQWACPRILGALLRMGRHSYEIYLTHMFIVFALFDLFLKLQKRMALVPVLFIVTIVLASLFGELVAKSYSEPMNRWLRARWGEGANRLGSVLDTQIREEEKIAAT